MRTSALGLLALLAVGCDAVSDPTGAAPGDARFSQGVTGNFPSAEGHALIGFERGAQAVSQSYSFTAQFVGRLGNQRLIGHWVLQQSAAGGDAQVHGRVECFISRPNSAELRGVIERSDNPAFPVDGFVTWTVVDNGEGANARPDEASPMTVFVAGAGPFCAGPEPLVPITHGNIQVRAQGGGGGQN